MEQRFKRVRKQLDDLGYMQVLIPEALPLVEKLVGDLIQTTESLRKYKEVATDALEERNNLQFGAEPYKCDNAKLVKECNDLHLTFLQYREQSENAQKDLKGRLSALEKEKLDCYADCEKLKKRIRGLELELSKKTDRILTFQNKNLQSASSNKFGSKSGSAVTLKSKISNPAFKRDTETSSTMALADQKISNLSKEIRKLKDEQLQMNEVTETYKKQLNNRDREIERLNQMLEGGRPLQALTQDCCYKNIDGRLYQMQKEICNLEKDKSEIEINLKDSLSKQHEAMKRALYLAERNKQLENELRDIDQMALAVEADCNTNVKINAEKVSRLQDRVHDTVLQIQTLEKDVMDLKRDKQELLSDIDALKLEKKHLQSVLETALDEKKRLNDRINQFTIIEHDLNLEIDRLVQTSANQKRKIAELECKLVAGKFDAVTERSQQVKQTEFSPEMSPERPIQDNSRKIPYKKPSKNRSTSPQLPKSSRGISSSLSPKKNKSPKKPSTHPLIKSKQIFPVPKNTPESKSSLSNHGYCYDHNQPVENYCDCCCCCCCCKPCNGRDINNQNNGIEPSSALEHCKSERDYYMKEYNRLFEQLKNIPSKPDNNTELLQKLSEKEQLLATLQYNNKSLAQEKHNLMIRLETARDRAEGEFDGQSWKSSLKKLERERDLLKGDILRLEEERNAIRQRLKIASESQVAEHARMEKTVIESEEQVRRLENERRELMQTQGSRRATISSLEEQCNTLKDQTRMSQTELNHQRALYSQLKTLHEQTDKALGDSQGQLLQVEGELEKCQERIRGLEKDRSQLDQEVASLKNDIMIMRGNLAEMDREKDGLLISVDNKTERVAMLEQELLVKEDKMLTLESNLAELKKKLSLTIDGSTSREHLLRTASLESTNLRQDLESARRGKEIAVQENRRLQDDLASCTADCRTSRNELEISKRQVEDLKRQLQHYVAEVKRFEDLISQKEVERSEMLDQFRSLSQEASMLENNNHSLENIAAQSKVQLSVTLDHVADLETKLTNQDDMMMTYETQISELTSQIASLENQLSQCKKQQDRTEADLVSLRDLCMKLDQQKDKLMHDLKDKDEQRAQVDRDMSRLRRESETLQTTLVRDRTSSENLERLLGEARQEAVQLKLYNEELEAEIQALKEKIADFESRLSPTGAHFTYSAKPDPVQENRSCNCCGANDSIGDVIDTSAAVANRTHQMSNCAGIGSGQLVIQRQIDVVEAKIPEWKSRKLEASRKIGDSLQKDIDNYKSAKPWETNLQRHSVANKLGSSLISCNSYEAPKTVKNQCYRCLTNSAVFSNLNVPLRSKSPVRAQPDALSCNSATFQQSCCNKCQCSKDGSRKSFCS